MAQSLRDVMTSNPCTIDANKSVAYAAKMMQEENVGLAPIVEGDMLVGMLTDRDIAIRVAAQGRDPEQVNVLEVASKKIVTRSSAPGYKSSPSSTDLSLIASVVPPTAPPGGSTNSNTSGGPRNGTYQSPFAERFRT